MVREAGPEKSLIFLHSGVWTCYVQIWRKQTKVFIQLEGSLYKLFIVVCRCQRQMEKMGRGVGNINIHNFPRLTLFCMGLLIT